LLAGSERLRLSWALDRGNAYCWIRTSENAVMAKFAECPYRHFDE
jgi:hypothetical protein